MPARLPGTYAVYLLPLVLAACGNTAAPDPRTEAPVVLTAPVERAASPFLSFTGTIGSRVQSDLGFRVSGKVVKRLVDAGQTVRKGQALMRIDPIDLGLEVSARAEAVTAARAHARQAIDDELRYRDVVAAGAVSASAYDQIKATAESAKAQLSAAQAQAGVAQNASSYASLVADSDGVVMDTFAEPGQVVSAGQTVVRLAHAGPREAIIQLPETVRPMLGSQAQASLYGQDNVVGNARLRQLSDAADRVTRTYEAKYVLDGKLAEAPIGATVTLKLTEKRSDRESMRVPAGAIFESGKQTGVWTLTGTPAQATWRAVHVVGIDDEAARIEGDLRVGDQVVALGAHLLHEGEKVRVKGPEQKSAASASAAQEAKK
jgi:RND family efflux transporter MFP subunit